jgi:hypothetical protein
MSSGGQSILHLDNLTGYQPTTQASRAAYESILVSLGFDLGDRRHKTASSFFSHTYLNYYFVLSSNAHRPRSVQRCFWATRHPPFCGMPPKLSSKS